ncbi:MAG: YgaP family membrane protein [Symbiobacteriia bacterium]
MKTNVGTVDRWIRGILGVVLLWLAFTSWGSLSWVFGIIGAILLITGGIGFCGLYKLFGISTCPTKPADLKK